MLAAFLPKSGLGLIQFLSPRALKLFRTGFIVSPVTQCTSASLFGRLGLRSFVIRFGCCLLFQLVLSLSIAWLFAAKNAISNENSAKNILAINAGSGAGFESLTVVQAGEQMRHSLVGFVAHIGETECFAAEFAVTWVDDQMMFFAKLFRHGQNINVLVVRDAGQGL